MQLRCLIKFPKKGAKRLFVALIKTYYFQLYFLAITNCTLHTTLCPLQLSVHVLPKKRKKECQAKPKTALIQLFVKIVRIALENSFDTTACL